MNDVKRQRYRGENGHDEKKFDCIHLYCEVNRRLARLSIKIRTTDVTFVQIW